MSTERDSLFDARRIASALMGGDAQTRAAAVDEIRALERKYEALRNLVVRFREWDDLPGRADGPFWMREADRVLADD